MTVLRSEWEETSFQLEHLQCNSQCVKQEQDALKQQMASPYTLTFDPETHIEHIKDISQLISE